MVFMIYSLSEGNKCADWLANFGAKNVDIYRAGSRLAC